MFLMIVVSSFHSLNQIQKTSNPRVTLILWSSSVSRAFVYRLFYFDPFLIPRETPFPLRNWFKHTFWCHVFPFLLYYASGENLFRSWTRQKYFDFFSVHDIPLRFISLNSIFAVHFDQVNRIFVHTLQQVHDLSFSIFLLP